MGIERSEVVKIITAIKVQCPEALAYSGKDEFNLLVQTWHEILKKYPIDIVWVAVRNALKNTVYQKQNWIGAICKEIEAMEELSDKTDGELWAELVYVLNNVSKVMYFGTSTHWVNGKLINPVEEVYRIYESLNPILKSYVGNASGLISLADQETLEFERGRFQKSIDCIRKRNKKVEETKGFLTVDYAKKLLENELEERYGV